MLKLVLQNLRARRERAALVVAGATLIAAAFALFAAVSSAATVTADQSLSRYWRTTYDILVRPPEDVTDIERLYGLVEANHLSGIPGGITFEEYEAIKSIPEVEVAAPIAMLGYVRRHPPIVGIRDPLPDGIYRVSATATIWDGHQLLTATLPGPYYAFYYQAVDQIPPWEEQLNREFGEELIRLRLLPAGSADFLGFQVKTPSLKDKMLLTAVDPEQEARLVHLDQMVVEDDYLPTEAPPLLDRRGIPIVPVLLNIHDYVSETISIRIEQVNVFDGEPTLMDGLRAISRPEEIESAPRQVVWEGTLPLRGEWRNIAPRVEVADGQVEIGPAWTPEFAGPIYAPAPVQYRVLSDLPEGLPRDQLVLEAIPVGITPTEERHENEDMLPSSLIELMDMLRWRRSPELIFRRLKPRSQQEVLFKAHVQGLFEVDALKALDGASPNRVPLETYFPPLVTLKYDEAGRPVEPPATLRPTLNAGGYLVSPPDMLITLDTARHLLTEGCIEWVPMEEWPYFQVEHVECPPLREDLISAIRVRVGGISELTPQAQARIEEVAQRIVELTGLHVDIMVGSSPQPVLVHIPGYGEVPGLGYVEEMWVKKGVTTQVTTGMNRADGLLFGVMLVACLLFLFDANYVSLLGRLPEFGLMRALGWRSRTLFGLVLGEAPVLGLLSGALGALVAVGIVWAFALAIPVGRIALLAPLGGGVFLLGALLPAWWAARVPPISVISAGETEAGRRVPGGASVLGYAVGGVLRRPARTVATLAGLALTGLGGMLYGTLLGAWIRTQVRPYHLTMGAVALLAAALGVAELMLLNVTQRRREIGLLVALGWRREDLFRVFLTESGLIGLAGGLLGTALAILLYRFSYGPLPGDVTTWLHVVGVGITLPLLATVLATLYPALRAARLLPLDALRGEERLSPAGALSRTMAWLGLTGAVSVGLVIALAWALGGHPAPPPLPVAGIPPPAPTATPLSLPPPPPAPTPTPVVVAELPRYQLDLIADVAGRRLVGQEHITFTNRTGSSLDTLALRLYPNRPVWTPQGTQQETLLRVVQARVDGRPVSVTLTASDTAALLPLDSPLALGERVAVDLAFELQVPQPADLPSDVWTLSSFFPMLAVHEEGGWRLDVCAFCGDVVYSESALYEFTVTAPAGWVIAATGEEVETSRNPDGTLTHAYEASPVRDLALALSPAFHVWSQRANGVVVSVYSLSDDPQAGEILAIATEAFSLFSKRFGVYPYSALRLVAFPSAGVAGMEYPGLIYLSYRPGDARLAPVIAHEVSHQWWYGVVGNDVFNEPWLDEALAQYSTMLYLEEAEGAEAARQHLREYEDERTRLRVLEGYDPPVGSPVWKFAPPKLERYFDIVYGKGGLFMDALRQEIGDEVFFKGWRTYYERHRFGVATGQGFLEAMQQAAGRDLRPFFEEWVGRPDAGEN
ncbi:MAG: M1 family aminopeptidase [Anaerolineae bacterium]